MNLKHEIAERFDSKMALKSPAHITMHMPFRWKDKRKEELTELMARLNKEIVPFEIELNGFGFFEPKVIYVDVKENQLLRETQQSVVLQCKTELKLLNSNYKDQVFRPHMTIAFRDLKKPRFHEAYEYFNAMQFSDKFKVDKVSLMKHDGKKWQAHE